MNHNRTFMAGFGMADITPLESVPMASYGDDLRRFSEGVAAPLQARALAVTDENGDSLVFVVGDLSWCIRELGDQIREKLEQELGIPGTHVVLSGIHTHDSVSPGHVQIPSVVNYRIRYVEGMTEAARLALADRKPARVFAGSVMTERMNFVRRYIMDDGSLLGDNAYGTGTCIDHHETEADGQLQLMRLVREGGPDILVSNFQSHPHLEGKKSLLSPQAIGAFRDAAEEAFGICSLHWQGACGNLNTHSRIPEENRTRKYEEWAKLLCGYAADALENLKEVKTGPIRTGTMTCQARVNHQFDGLQAQAEDVCAYFKAGHSAQESAEYAWQYGINSYYHAARILSNAKEGESRELMQYAFSFGDIGGVVLPYEMFDTNGMYIKRNSPFAMTFVVGYSWPAYCGYIPSGDVWKNGGYEVDNCTYAPGTAEELADNYLALLNRLHGEA